MGARSTSIVAAVCCLAIGVGAAEAKKDLAGEVESALPPGLAKKDLPISELPPGQARKQPEAVEPPAPAPSAPPAAAQSPTATPPAAPSTPTGRPSRPRPASTPRRPQPAPSAPAPRRSAPVAPAGATARQAEAPSIAAPVPTRRSSADRPARRQPAGDDSTSVVTRTVRDIVETVPGWMKAALGGLLALTLLLGAGYGLTAIRARALRRQRSELLGEVGLLQRALLPPVPEKVGALATSVAYRPADGPGAGGDFYDVVALPGKRAAFILGDVSGHGRDALERTAFMRYTLRAYLEAGIEPRVALAVAERAIGERLGGDFATVLLAVHDPVTASLTYAAAGHPAPIVLGPRGPFRAVVAGSSPPIGVGERTGLRQTTIPLEPGAVACLYTDGLTEARVDDGLLGSERLEEILARLGAGASASELIERVVELAERTPDDMAACVLAPTAGITSGGFRTEQLELSAEELSGPLLGRFLAECGVGPAESEIAVREARELAGAAGAVVDVAFGPRRTVEVLPRNVESIVAASQRSLARAV